MTGFTAFGNVERLLLKLDESEKRFEVLEIEFASYCCILPS